MLKPIEIDWDIHRAIDAERRGFDEAPYHALRRLLGLPDLAEAEIASKPTSFENKKSDSNAGIPWVEDGVEIPHGSLARMSYNHGRQNFDGTFLNGKLVVNGRSYKTLSSAASDIAVTKKGRKTQLNGWLYWEVKFPGEDVWMRLEDLRKAEFRELLEQIEW